MKENSSRDFDVDYYNPESRVFRNGGHIYNVLELQRAAQAVSALYDGRAVGSGRFWILPIGSEAIRGGGIVRELMWADFGGRHVRLLEPILVEGGPIVKGGC